MEIQLHSKQTPIKSISISMANVKKVFQLLSAQVAKQANIELQELKKGESQSDEDFREYKKNARNSAFQVLITITGKNGSSMLGNSEELFDSPNLPETITSIFMSNIGAYQNFTKQAPVNNFALTLDFSKPIAMDSSNPVSSPTPNNSGLNIEGDSDDWIATISSAVFGVLEEKKNSRSWLHRSFVYDFGLFLLGIPLGIYTGWKSSPIVEKMLGSMGNFATGAAYVYMLFMVLWSYRIIFGYTKWIFPSVELKESSKNIMLHRSILGAIFLGVIVEILSNFFDKS